MQVVCMIRCWMMSDGTKGPGFREAAEFLKQPYSMGNWAGDGKNLPGDGFRERVAVRYGV